MTSNSSPHAATFEVDDVADAIGSRSVRSLMSESVTSISPASTLKQAAAALSADDISLIVVGEFDQIEGVVSERDIVQAVGDGLDLDATSVTAMESRDLLWAGPDSTIARVAAEMMENYVRHILIRGDDGELVGIVSMRDVLTEYLD